MIKKLLLIIFITLFLAGCGKDESNNSLEKPLVDENSTDIPLGINEENVTIDLNFPPEPVGE
ncbi:MAG: hypothetical protein MR902_08345 [Campylobacter sp.]|nr:hypothetical protein [Campylobacter sp.]